jgi:hypothetical protein
MTEYRPEHERLLYNLGLAGAAFKKVYFDPALNRQTAMFIPAEDLIIPYGASSANTAERVTHLMRKTKNEIRHLQVAGFYRDIDLGEPDNTHTDVEKKKAEGQGYSLTDDEELLMYKYNDNESRDYKEDDYFILNFLTAKKKIECGDIQKVVTGLGMSSKKNMEKLITWLLKEKVIDSNGVLNTNKLDTFYEKYNENITERTIR